MRYDDDDDDNDDDKTMRMTLRKQKFQANRLLHIMRNVATNSVTTLNIQ